MNWVRGSVTMSVIMVGLATVSVVLMSARAAADPASHPASARHQLMACMTKHMSASKTLSYNEATRVCKAQMKSQSATLASGTGVKSAGGMSP
jgi:hypothetical protein